MIPPLRPLRLRSIERWLQENRPQLSAAERSSTAMSMDESMLEAFDAMEEALQDEMMRRGTWGTASGMQEFPTARLELWNEVLTEFLPAPTSEPSQEP